MTAIGEHLLVTSDRKKKRNLGVIGLATYIVFFFFLIHVLDLERLRSFSGGSFGVN